jgi:hypothetical protein
MGHGGMTVIGVIGNSLLYSVCDSRVSIGHGGMALMGEIGNHLFIAFVMGE